MFTEVLILKENKLIELSMDFSVKIIKLCETEYWLELFVKSDILDREVAVGLYNQCGTIRRLLIASINTAKEKHQS